MKRWIELMLLFLFAAVTCAALFFSCLVSFEKIPPLPSARGEESFSESTETLSENDIPIESSPKDALDLNTATLEELQSLPGIGPKLGKRILDYREEYGKFFSVDELLEVPGIGEKKLEAIREMVKAELDVRY